MVTPSLINMAKCTGSLLPCPTLDRDLEYNVTQNIRAEQGVGTPGVVMFLTGWHNLGFSLPNRWMI